MGGQRLGSVAWIDAPAGLSGDMFLGALVDAGLPVSVLADVAQGLGLKGVEVRARRVMRGAIAATKVDVCRDGKPIEGRADQHLHPQDHDPDHAHRGLAEMLHILGHLGDVETAPLAHAATAFRHLAEAEARVHGTTADQVHFHEVGAADALVDVAGTCVGLHHLGVEAVRVSALPWGSGTVETAHGTMPIPAPATVRLLEGLPTFPSAETYEQVTPTGAALVRALAVGSTPPVGFVPRATGHGAGGFDGSRLPNILRLVVGDVLPGAQQDTATLLETNLDDVTGQVAAHALEQAMAAGALDAWWTPIHMKKGRPGLKLSVLVRPEDTEILEAVLFRETPTLGIRRRGVERSVLARRFEEVETPWGAVRIKVREGPAGAQGTPEYEDCLTLAQGERIAVRRVIEAAQAAWVSASHGR